MAIPNVKKFDDVLRDVSIQYSVWRTDRRTSCDGIVRDYTEHRAVKLNTSK